MLRALLWSFISSISTQMCELHTFAENAFTVITPSIQVKAGEIQVVMWTVDHEYPQISIREGSGLLFKWSGSTPHDLVEMSSPQSTSPDCTFVGSSAHSLGKVVHMYIQAIRTYSGTFYCDVGRQERPNFNKRLCRHLQLLFNLQ